MPAFIPVPHSQPYIKLNHGIVTLILNGEGMFKIWPDIIIKILFQASDFILQSQLVESISVSQSGGGRH